MPQRLGVSLRKRTRDKSKSEDAVRRRRRGGRGGQAVAPWNGSQKVSGCPRPPGTPFPLPWAPWGCHFWMLIIHDADALPGFNAL